jgi:hypothetical protein
MANKQDERIGSTLESEQDYRNYIQEQREKQFQKKFQKKKEEIEQDYNKNPKLDMFTARVTKIKFHQAKTGMHIIKFEDVRGKEHTSRVEAGLPEDKNSKYVRLCEFVGVDPKNLAELRGEIIPIRSSNDEVKIDYPPVQEGLNPYYYRIRRGYSRLAEAIGSREKVKESLSWIRATIGFLLPVIRFLVPVIGFLASWKFLVWVATEDGLRAGFGVRIGFTACMAFIGLGLYLSTRLLGKAIK